VELLDPVLFESKILDLNLESKLADLCEFAHNCKWRLLYRASDDGFSVENFHAKCDRMSNTLTIVKEANNGHIFGGYTQTHWDKSDEYKCDDSAFIFSLVNRDKAPVKMKIRKDCETCAIRCCASYGPTFGGGHDIFIANNANANMESYSNLGNSYKLFHHSYGSHEAKTFLADSNFFKVSEIEIYQQIN
jgi:hypothetical protein